MRRPAMRGCVADHMVSNGTLQAFVGWGLTFLYLMYFSARYYDSIRYDLGGGARAANTITAFARPIHPRYAAPRYQYWAWYGAFFFYVWCLYFVIQILFDAVMLGGGDAAALTGGAGSNVWVSSFPQLLAATVIFGGMSSIPGVEKALSLARQVCHDSAHIPRRARMMVSSMHAFPKTFAEAEIARARRIGNRIGDDDGEAPADSAAYRYLYACYLIAALDMKKNARRKYFHFLDSENSGFDLLRRQIEIIDGRIGENLQQGRDRFPPGDLDTLVETVFANAVQVYVCATVSSERNFASALRAIRSDGIPVNLYRDFNFYITKALGALAVMVPVLFLLSFAAYSFVSSDEIESGPARAAWNTTFATLLVVVVPIFVVYALKAALIDGWPLGYDGQERADVYPFYLLATIAGTAAAAAGLFILAYYRVLDPEGGLGWWLERLPWVSVPALLCLIAARTVDRAPRRRTWRVTSANAVCTALLAAAGSLVIGLILSIVEAGAPLAEVLDPESGFWLKRAGAMMAATGIVGLLLGAFISVVSDFGVQLPQAVSEEAYRFGRFLAPVAMSLRLPDEAWGDIRLNAEDFPSHEIHAQLVGDGFIDAGGGLTEKALAQVA